jgi:hypothetical protein
MYHSIQIPFSNNFLFSNYCGCVPVNRGATLTRDHLRFRPFGNVHEGFSKNTITTTESKGYARIRFVGDIGEQ